MTATITPGHAALARAALAVKDRAPRREGATMRGEGLRAWREKLGVSQARAAKWAGVTENSWWRWEQGRYAVPLFLQRRIESGETPLDEAPTVDAEAIVRERVTQYAVPGFDGRLVLKVGEQFIPVPRILEALGVSVTE